VGDMCVGLVEQHVLRMYAAVGGDTMVCITMHGVRQHRFHDTAKAYDPAKLYA